MRERKNKRGKERVRKETRNGEKIGRECVRERERKEGAIEFKFTN